MQNIEVLFLLFIIYSIIGWLLETVLCSIEAKKIVNRGFLIGPYCPIYGVGSIAMILNLQKYMEDPFILFCVAVVICSTLEYITSYGMEKLFKARWWDYSKKKLNINGRVCLANSVFFGISGILMMYFINPFVNSVLFKIPLNILVIISGVVLFAFCVDNVISFFVMFGIKDTIVKIKKDSTEEITQRVRNMLMEKSFFSKRVLQAFPNVQSQIDRIKDNISREKEKLLKEKEKIERELRKKLESKIRKENR